MRKATADERGTVQLLAQDLDSAHENGEFIFISRARMRTPDINHTIDGVQFQLSTRAVVQAMPEDLYSTVLRHFKVRRPDLNLRSWLAASAPDVDSLPLQPSAQFFEHAIVRQVRYVAGRGLKSSADSIVCVQAPMMNVWVGELLDVFVIDQPRLGLHRLGRVRWMRPIDIDVSATIWESA